MDRGARWATVHGVTRLILEFIMFRYSHLIVSFMVTSKISGEEGASYCPLLRNHQQ